MADARFRDWHRAGPKVVTMTAVIAGLMAPGCGDGNPSASGGSGGTTTSSTSSGGTGGTGGMTGGTGGMTGGSTGGFNPAVTEITKAKALDSTPDSTGDVIYFTASSDEGPGVFSVPGNGGAATKVFAGDPFAAPLGISISNDDKTLLVADPGAESDPDDPKTALGAIWSLPVGGAAPTALNGSSGTMPRGLDIGDDSGEETIFFTGVDTADGEPGVFKMPVGGGTPKAVAKGAPFVDPSGIAVGKTKTFVTDTIASANKLGSVLLVEGGTATVYLPEIGVGYPTGVALSSDEKTLYLSGIDPETGIDVILIVDVATKMVTPYSMGIEKNRDAGGLHRARKSDVFSWSDLTAGGTGAVYRVTFK